VRPGARAARLVAGVLVLLVLVALCVLLVPPYAANFRLQRYVSDFIDDPAASQQPLDAVRARVLNKAASLGLPVRMEDVHVAASQGALRIDVLYIVHVDMAGYTVDLHFRPAAGGGRRAAVELDGPKRKNPPHPLGQGGHRIALGGVS
jgi:hypothetical protein